MLNFKRLQCFITVYEELNITKASQQLFVTQQGLSRTIKAIEEEIGFPLFVRNNNGLQPTAYGDSLYQYAKHIVQDIKNASIELERIKNQTQNELRIGVSNGVFPAMNVDIPISLFKKAHPEINLSLVVEADTLCESMLQSGDVNCAFLVGRINDPNLSITQLYHEPLYAWIHRDHPLAKKEYVTLSDLIDQPLIMINDQYNYYKTFKQWCITRGLKPDIRYRLNDVMTIYYLAAKNEGIALHPKYWQNMLVKKDELVDVPVVDKNFSSWQISLCSYNNSVSSMNESLFTQFILKYYAEHPFN